MKSLMLNSVWIFGIALQSLLFGQSWIVSTTPAQNALNIDPAANILVTFNQDIDPATLTNATIRSNGSLSGLHPSGSITYNSAAKTATFDPDTDFNLGEIVQVTLTTGIQNLGGNPMPAPFCWSFTVGSLSGSGLFVEADSTDIGSFSWGIIAGDWDGDGDLDLAVANDDGFQGTTVSILENDGHANYTEIAVITVGNSPRNLTAGDFDGDGDLDIAVIVTYASAITILVNDGNGNFSPFQPTATVNNAIDLTAADFDGNGMLDLVVAATNAIYTLSNDGSGNFVIASVTPVAYLQSAITNGDFDGDGDFDLAATGWPSDTLAIFLNNGSGNFSQTSTLNIERAFYPPNTADVDGDGDLDLLVPRSNSHGFLIFINDGNANFDPSIVVSTGAFSSAIEPADYDNDGDLDLAVASGLLRIFQNEGNLNFTQTGQHFPLGDGVYGITSGDLDNDGDLDLAVTAYRNAVVIYKNRQLEQDILLSGASIDFGVAKIDSTRSKTFKIYNLGVAQNLEISSIVPSNPVFTANPAGGILLPGDSLTVTVSFTPSTSATYRDSITILSNDPETPELIFYVRGHGYPIVSTAPGQHALNVAPDSDIIIAFAEDMNPASLNNNTVKVNASQSGRHFSSNIGYNGVTRELIFDPDSDFLIGEQVNVTMTTGIENAAGDTLPTPYQWNFTVQALNGSAVFEHFATLSVGGVPNSLAGGDFDNDGDLDLAVLAYSLLAILMNDGSGNFSQTSSLNLGNELVSLSAEDFDNDGDLDLAAFLYATGQIRFFTNGGNGNFVQSQVFAAGFNFENFAFADFDGDGFLDILVDGQSGSLLIFKNDGSGSFYLYSTLAIVIRLFTAGDFDNDGDWDVAATSQFPYPSVYILENDGTGKLGFFSLAGVSEYEPEKIRACDVNGDGALDLIVAYYASNKVSILENDGAGNFTETYILDSGMPSSIVTGDWEGDGDLDLAFASGPLKIYTNDGSGTFTLFSTVSAGSPNRIKSGDFDGDGDLDLFGVNSNPVDNIVLLQNREPFQNMALSSEIIDYGVVQIDSAKTKSFKIYNTGSGVNLQISSIVASHPAFSVAPDSGTVLPRDSLVVAVTFTASQRASYRDSLLIYSDDPTTAAATVQLRGAGYPLISVDPPQNGLNAGRDGDISITFSEEMNPAAFNNTTIKVSGSQSGWHSAGNIAYNSALKMVTFTPDHSFKPGETANVLLTTGIQTAAGDTMPAPLQWSFTVATYADTGSAVFPGFTRTSDPAAGNYPTWIVPFDLEGDGDLDLAVTGLLNNILSILENDEDGQFTPLAPVQVGDGPWGVAAADFNGDGYWDLSTAGQDENVTLLWNEGSGSLIPQILPFPGARPAILFPGDFERDWDVDLTFSDMDLRKVSILTNASEGLFIESAGYPAGVRPFGIACGDFNGDGALDWVATDRGANTALIFLNDGAGNFFPGGILTVSSGPRNVAVNDLDNDGDLDIIVTNPFSSGTLTIFANDGTGNFTAFDTLAISGGPYFVSAGDLDNDGDLDLAVTKFNVDSLAIFRNGGQANFTLVAMMAVGDDPIMVCIADLDGDNDLDLAVANSASDNITILKNDLIVGIGITPAALPKQFALHQNFPNPFNPATTIRYDLPKPAQVNLTIYNILGQKVRTLVNAFETAGYKSVVWDGKNEFGHPVGSGVYIYRLSASGISQAGVEAGDFRKSLKLLLVK